MEKIKAPNVLKTDEAMAEVEAEVAKKNSGNKFLILLIFLAALCVMTPTAIGLLKSFSIQKETRELHSLQNEASAIKNDASALKKRITEFNKKIDGVSQTKEKYPPDEPVPQKINPCKILAGKEAP